MSLSIDEAIKKVLSFLKSIPMAPATVKYYSCCCSHVRDYCQRNALQEFSYKDAASFTAEQLKLAENGKFGKIYALIMRKAAYYVADCFETGTLEWKRNRYTITELPENYQQILGSFEESISGKLAEGSVYNIIHEIRKFLKYLEKAGCLIIQDLSADILRAYVIQEAPKHMGNYVNLTWPLKKFLAYVKKSGVALSGTFDFFLANPAPVHERVLPAFDDDETKAILESIDTSTKQGRRDYAVVMLALDTGLRWSKREIRVKQEKTDTPLTLPLTLRAGTAVADYILEARPKCSSPYVFLRLRKPYSSMLSSASPTKDLMGRYFKKNGIEHHFGDGKTFHGLRRTISLFADDIQGMVEYKAALGHKCESYAWALQTFDRYCLSHHPDSGTLTQEIAFGFCQAGTDGKNCGYRAGTVREFGRYLSAIGKEAYILPMNFFPQKKADLPYIMSDNEIRSFFGAADRYPHADNSPLLEYTVPVIFRLQFATGMRPQEARALKRADFNFSKNMIYIDEAKGHRDRRILTLPNVMELCRKYDAIAESLHPGRTYFFPSPDGSPYTHGWMTEKFHKCWENAGNNTSSKSCTPYDLRHNFATRTLMRWVEEGKDLNAYAPYLSTYMGHVTFNSTFYYIHLLPEKLGIQKFMDIQGIIPEVPHES